MEQLGLDLGHDFREITPEELRRRILADIEQKALISMKLGFKSRVLDVLDDPDATASQIEALKTLIDRDVLMRLYEMSNALYFGKLRVGETISFLDIVMRLGMKQTRTLILALSFFSVTKDHELRVLAARSFATLMLCRMVATEAGYRKDVQERLELGGLMYEIGKVVMFLYRNYHARFDITDEFIEANHYEMGLSILERFNLPVFLKEVFTERRMSFDDESFGVPGIIFMVNGAVDATFRRYGKFLVSAPVASSERFAASTFGTVMLEQFGALGLGDLIEVVTPGMSLQK